MKHSFRRDPINKANSLVNYKVPNTSRGRVFSWHCVSLPHAEAWQVITKHKDHGFNNVSAMCMAKYHKSTRKVVNMFGNRLVA